MAQPRNRVIYQSEALYASEQYNSTGVKNHTQLYRVQSANYGFTINRQDVNQFGNLARIDSLILEPPTVNFDISYYPTNGYNERALGFSVTNVNNPNESQFSSGALAGGSGQNFYILTVDDGFDANLDRPSGHTNHQVIAIGNAFLTDYTLDLAVGSLPTATVTFEASNIASDTTVTGDTAGAYFAYTGVSSPAVEPTAGVPLSDANARYLDVHLPFATGNSWSGVNGNYISDAADKLSALRPGDISFDLTSFNGTALSTIGGTSGIHVQSASLSLPLSRTPIERLGSKFPFARVVDFPVNATLTVNAFLNTVTSQNLATLISGCGDQSLQDVTIGLKECGSSVTGLKITMKGATLDSESFSSSIGSNKSVDLTFSTQIGGIRDLQKGIFVSGSNDTLLPWEY